jgi:hypothetical protein
VRRPALVAAAIFAATLVSRLPFLSQHLWAWDSVLYARALESGFHVDYELADQRPHPPGYLLYVATAFVVRTFTHDSNAALVLVSAVASALAAAAVFLLARRFASDRAAAFAAAAFAVAPLVWQYSVVAYPYAVLGPLSACLVAWFMAARSRGTAAAALIASAGFGAIAGFRQDLLLVLAAVWVWSIWPLSGRAKLAAAASLCAGSLVWLAPTMLLSDGPLDYVDALIRQSDYVRATYSVQAQGLPALLTNLGATLHALAWGLWLCAIPIAGLAVARARRVIRERRLALGGTDAVLIAWIAPALLIFVVLHIGEPGYVLSVLPGFYVLAAVGIDRAAWVPRLPRRAVLASALLAPAVVFLWIPAPFSKDTITGHDAALAARVSFVRQHYPPETTLLLAREDYLLVRYYLSEYRAWFHDFDPYRVALRRRRAPDVTAIIAFSPGLRPASAKAKRIAVARGIQLVHLGIEPRSIVELYGERYGVVETPPR